jgi:serine/threonine protein kinase
MSQVNVIEPTSFGDGRFEVVETLGEGATAIVYKVKDKKFGGVLRALKVLRANMGATSDAHRRFVKEALDMARVENPGFIRVIDYDQNGGPPWILMELAEGGSLLDRLEHGQLTPRQAVRVCLAVLRALAFAHERGVVHRDIKPHNILFTWDSQVKVVDFGIAQSDSVDLETRQGTTMGTFFFMAPEQKADASLVDKRADIYATGALFYCCMVVGVPPDLFVAEQHPQWLEKIPEFLRPILVRATRYERDDRFSSAGEMIAALEEVYELLPSSPDDDLPLALPVGWRAVEETFEEPNEEDCDRATDPGQPRDSESLTIVPPPEVARAEGTWADADSVFQDSTGLTSIDDVLSPPRRRLPIRIMIAAAIVLVLLVSFVGIKWLGHSDELIEEPIVVSTEIETPLPEVQDPMPEPVTVEPVVEVVPEEPTVTPEPESKPEVVRTEVVPPPKVEERPVVVPSQPVEPSTAPVAEAVSTTPSHNVITALKAGQSFSPVVRGQHKEVKVHLLLNGKWTISNMTVGEDGVWRVTITIPEGIVSFRYFITAVPAWSSGSAPNAHSVEIR